MKNTRTTRCTRSSLKPFDISEKSISQKPSTLTQRNESHDSPRTVVDLRDVVDKNRRSATKRVPRKTGGRWFTRWDRNRIIAARVSSPSRAPVLSVAVLSTLAGAQVAASLGEKTEAENRAVPTVRRQFRALGALLPTLRNRIIPRAFSTGWDLLKQDRIPRMDWTAFRSHLGFWARRFFCRLSLSLSLSTDVHRVLSLLEPRLNPFHQP